MALSSSIVWECRASGASDNNGGGFKAGASGTDFSQQNSAQLTLTDLATTGVVTTLTSVTGGFTSAMVGNLVQIVSGTNFTAGFYEVTAFTNSNTVTLDRAPSTAAGAAGTGSVGGALATLGKLAGAMVGGNKGYVTGTGFTSVATITFTGSGIGSGGSALTRVIGYGSTRGDAGHAALTLQTNTGLTGISTSAGGFLVEQLDIDCASLGSSTGFGISSTTASGWEIRNCKISNFTADGITSASSVGMVNGCEVTGGTSAATAAIRPNAARTVVIGCSIHDNACPGIKFDVSCTGCLAHLNLIANNSGASSDGIFSLAGNAACLLQNTVHGNGRDGIRTGAAYAESMVLRNLLTSNGGYGFNDGSTAYLASSEWDGNAFYNNTSGSRNNVDSVAGIYGSSPYTNSHDVTLTVSPYVGPTTGSTANFALNNTAGGGAACRGKGVPSTWPGNTGTTGYLDMGAVQHQDAWGPPSILVVRGQNVPSY